MQIKRLFLDWVKLDSWRMCELRGEPAFIENLLIPYPFRIGANASILGYGMVTMVFAVVCLVRCSFFSVPNFQLDRKCDDFLKDTHLQGMENLS
jgi:hypothetical protein